MKTLSAALMLSLAAGLAGCGPVATSSVEPRPVALPVSATTGTGNLGALLNAQRAQNGAPALAPSAQLAAAAQVHASDIARTGAFSHTGSDGSEPSDRVRAQGYAFCFVAENIAQGYPNATQVMEGWMKSRGHRRNNLSPQATEYGAARAGDNYWVLVLGRPGC